MTKVIIVILALLFAGIAIFALAVLNPAAQKSKATPPRPRVKPAQPVDPWDVDKLRRGQREF